MNWALSICQWLSVAHTWCSQWWYCEFFCVISTSLTCFITWTCFCCCWLEFESKNIFMTLVLSLTGVNIVRWPAYWTLTWENYQILIDWKPFYILISNLIDIEWHHNDVIFHLNFMKFKGIHNPQYLPNDFFFALSTFLDDLKPSHLNLSIQICL